MIAKGLRWMFNPESPFYVKPRVDFDLMRWGWLFYRHSTAAHVAAVSELLRDLNLESRRLFAELQQDGDYGLEQRGLLMLCKTQKGLDGEAEVASAAHRIGLKAEVLDAKQTAALDPGITMDVTGSVYFPDDCHLDPARFMTALRQKVISLGGTILDQTEVHSIERSNGKAIAVTGPKGRWEADQFVIAGGSWSAPLLKTIGMKLPLQAGKGYSLTLPEPPQLPKLCSIFAEAKVAITPMGESLRFAGTMEVGGLNTTINPARVRGIVKSVNQYFPKFSESDFTNVAPWAGLRPVSPDGVPYLGKAPGADNLIVASGHAMMGLSLGPVTGKLVSDLLTSTPTFRDIAQMAPARF
jgi:D-amino-acid dehydrogenase